MKKIIQPLNAALILIFFFSSCSVEKRKYVSGYNIQWKNSKHNIKKMETAQNHQPVVRDTGISAAAIVPAYVTPDETVTASADNSVLINDKVSEKSNHPAAIFPEECDVIMLKNGNEIKAKVSEITKSEIKYQKCEDTNGRTFTLKKSEVFMIKYPNGTKDIIARDAPAEVKNKPTEKEDNGIFGILSISCILGSIIFGIFTGGLAAILLIPAAIIFGAIGIGSKRKLKGLAMAGLILGIATVLLTVLLAIALSSMSFGFGD